MPPAVAAARLSAARQPDRFEAQDTAFFERVRQAYLQRQQAQPERFVLVDAAQTQADVAGQIQRALQQRGCL